MQYHFDSLESLALHLEQMAAKSRKNAKALSELVGPGKAQRQLKIASYNSEAYGFEQSAHTVRNSVIIAK